MIHSPNIVQIDLQALTHNLQQVRKLIAQDTRIMGVVKSDAYGHGLVPVSQVLEKNKIDCLGVANLSEALEIKKNGIRIPVVILCGVHTREEIRSVIQHNLIPVLSDLNVADLLSQEGARQGKKIKVQLKVDTGMGRLGISYNDIAPCLQKIMGLKNLELEALTSHLSSADEEGDDFTETQIRRFKKAIETGHSIGLDLPLNNLANSAGVMGYKDAHFEMVRPGISLYGGLPSPGFKSPIPLKPVMHFKGRVLQIRNLPDNTPVSYGRTYYTRGTRQLAILSAGYGDGLPRSMSNKGKALVKGQRVPIVGTICMNLSICDITGLSNIEPGEPVVFLGRQDKEVITGDDLARWAGTVSYEVFCSIGQRNRKEYLQ